MKDRVFVFLSVVVLLTGVPSAKLQADGSQKTLIITMTNDAAANAVVVIDAATHARLQSISTNGKGGVGGNARGVRQYNDRLVAAVNNGSGTVAVFRRAGDRLEFEQL